MNRQFTPQKRRRSREIALQLVYEMDLMSDHGASLVCENALFAQEPDRDVADYARVLIDGVERHREVIDSILRDCLQGWRPERMVAVDRGAIRLAIMESVIEQLVPVPVAISEYIELVKLFGTEDSGRFVNGVLGRIVRTENDIRNAADS